MEIVISLTADEFAQIQADAINRGVSVEVATRTAIERQMAARFLQTRKSAIIRDLFATQIKSASTHSEDSELTDSLPR